MYGGGSTVTVTASPASRSPESTDCVTCGSLPLCLPATPELDLVGSPEDGRRVGPLLPARDTGGRPVRVCVGPVGSASVAASVGVDAPAIVVITICFWDGGEAGESVWFGVCASALSGLRQEPNGRTEAVK